MVLQSWEPAAASKMDSMMQLDSLWGVLFILWDDFSNTCHKADIFDCQMKNEANVSTDHNHMTVVGVPRNLVGAS